MSSTVPLTPCPKCGNPHNKGRVKYESSIFSSGVLPYVYSEVNCSNCGFFYDGRTNYANLPPLKNWVIGCFINLAVVTGIVIAAIICVVIYGLIMY